MSVASGHAALIERILHGARWATLLKLSAQTISWLSTLIVVRFVSSTDYGLNAMLEAPLELLFLVSTLGLDYALVRATRLDAAVIRPAFGWLLLVNGALFCAYFFGSPFIAGYFGEPRLVPLAMALSSIFLLVPFRAIPNALLDRELKFRLRATVELLASIAAAVTSLTLAVLGHGVWALVIGVLVSRTLGAALLMWMQPWFALPSFSIATVRGLLATGSRLTLASALAITASMMPVVLAGPQLGAAQLGLYSVALQFAMLPLSKIMPVVNSIAFPAFAKFEGQPEAVGPYALTCLGAGALALFPVLIGLACAGPAFTAGVLGPQWTPATPALVALALVMPLRGVSLFLRQVMNGIGREALTLVCAIVIWISALAAILAGLRFGITGLVAAFVATELIGAAITWALATRAMALSAAAVRAAFKAPTLATGAMALAVVAAGRLSASLPPLTVLLIQVLAGGCVYLGMLRLFFAKEAQQLIRLIRP